MTKAKMKKYLLWKKAEINGGRTAKERQRKFISPKDSNKHSPVNMIHSQLQVRRIANWHPPNRSKI
ncbi:hypothetical protein FLT15_04175 [Paenibacillus thiaminolyticus]|uniref:hypothetical protein n=1 Tax=Paenibacillus thiaminolyticus TaxID=49283 RepID=UPI0011654A8F|nr:hypothetical protein [Paenibacillus thiaminolyticus]MDG0874594.1 hypothetical protein [Paenibacillus thiaminolyticus]NGP57611.1 hypothetical protein [Paenibacillus thiaminolyticus]